MARRKLARERGRCSVCRLAVEVVVLSPTTKIAPQHPRPRFEVVKSKTFETVRPGFPTQENLLGCRGSGAIALDIFAAGPS